jgi:UDP-N-acetyl-D-galactosamine dehydrogenase
LSFSNLYNDIVNRKEKISLIGLGYVGMPIAVSFSRKADVIGFDVNQAKIDLYKSGIDPTKEVGDEAIAACTVDFTADETRLREAKFHIVAVPTPVNADHTPDLSPVIGASTTLGRNLTKGSIVVYESTVYPGVTEEICVPILERESGLKCGVDFKIGYSPERINPGDKVHRLETIVKVVSGMDEETLDIVAKVYELVVEAGVYRAESIKVAEAAKVIENSQRDINIAFMNELSIIFNRMGIDTKAVLEAAGTKWNSLKFTPGLVGGHCIGVDPYYLTYKAEQMGYHSQIILAGRRINDDMGKYVAENTVKKMIQANKPVKGANVAILGITFKENCPDSRNTRVIDIIKELKEYGVNVQVIDPVADAREVLKEYGIRLNRLEDISGVDAVIFAVAHEEFVNLSLEEIKDWYRTSPNHFFNAINQEQLAQIAATIEDDCDSTKNVLIDVKGIFDRKEAEALNYLYWRL